MVMPLGMKNAPTTFMHLIAEELSDYTREFSHVDLDHILIYSKIYRKTVNTLVEFWKDSRFMV